MREELRAKYTGKQFNIEEAVRKARQTSSAPTFVDERRYGPGNQIEHFPSVRVLELLVTGEGKGTTIEPSDAFRERVLKGLGALEQDQNLNSLTLLPGEKEGYRGPVYRGPVGYECAERVPTNISGVDLRVDYKRPSIFAYMDTPTLQKVVNFPHA